MLFAAQKANDYAPGNDISIVRLYNYKSLCI
jgi:hypothetical protein